MKVRVGIVAGSKSDIPKLERGLGVLNELGIAYRIAICSAHRDPERLKSTISEWETEGVSVFIAAAGLAAHLPGVTAAMTLKPVIGVPLDAAMDGLDALLSIVQMPPGVPVATVGVGNSANAAILAAQIISLTDEDVATKLRAYRIAARDKAREENEALGR